LGRNLSISRLSTFYYFFQLSCLSPFSSFFQLSCLSPFFIKKFLTVFVFFFFIRRPLNDGEEANDFWSFCYFFFFFFVLFVSWYLLVFFVHFRPNGYFSSIGGFSYWHGYSRRISTMSWTKIRRGSHQMHRPSQEIQWDIRMYVYIVYDIRKKKKKKTKREKKNRSISFFPFFFKKKILIFGDVG
jgi:hypothetical protein